MSASDSQASATHIQANHRGRALREALPIAELDVSCFGCPAGWVEERDESSRRRKKKWIQLDPQGGGVLREVDRGELRCEARLGHLARAALGEGVCNEARRSSEVRACAMK